MLALLNTVSKETMSKGCILFWWLAIYCHFKHDDASIALRFLFQLVDMMRQTTIYEPHLSGKSSWGDVIWSLSECFWPGLQTLLNLHWKNVINFAGSLKTAANNVYKPIRELGRKNFEFIVSLPDERSKNKIHLYVPFLRFYKTVISVGGNLIYWVQKGR